MNEPPITWLQTRSGLAVDIDCPKVEQICIDDIAWGLSMICRFAGHCDAFYSVAQHSVHVSEIAGQAGPGYALPGLLHDAEEAYLGDWISPMKNVFRIEATERGTDNIYAEIAQYFKKVIAYKFGVDLIPEPAAVKMADRVMLATERRDLRCPPPRRVEDMPPPWRERIEPWPQRYAYETFLRTFNDLTGNASLQV